MNDTDSDGGSFSQLSDCDMCKLNSPISSSRGKERNCPVRSRQTTGRAIPKCAYTDFESGWEEQIQNIQKPAISGVTWINKNFPVTQDSCPLDTFEIFFSTELFKHI